MTSINEENQQEDKGLFNIDEVGKKIDSAIVDMSGKKEFRSRTLNKVMTFIGTSGGVGSSTLVSTLAVELENKGLSVLVIDLDIMYPTQHILFNLYTSYDVKAKDLVTYMQGLNKAGESIQYSKNVGVMVANNRTLQEYIGLDNGDMSKEFEKLLDGMTSSFDIILIDCPSSKVEFDLVNTAMYKSDTIYCVLDDGVKSIVNTEKFINNCEITGIHTKKIKYIMNKRTSFFYPENNIKSMGIELEAIIPFEIGVIECGLKGQIYTLVGKATSKSSNSYMREINKLRDKLIEDAGGVISK